jgi:hypothetical protein
MSQAEIREYFDELLEKGLFSHLGKLHKGKGIVELIGEVIEYAYKENPGHGEQLRSGLDFLMPEILNNGGKQDSDNRLSIDVDDIVAACIFSSHYRQTRDLIFCSFRSPEAISWELTEKRIKITVKDRSFFRQIACETQTFFMNSMTSFAGHTVEKAEKLCENTKYWDMDDPKVLKLLDLLENEAEIKIAHYFDYLPRNSSVDIGGFTYADFIKVFKSSLIVALYERLWNSLHKSGSVVSYLASDLAKMYGMTTGLDETICQRILKDLSTASRGTLNYIASTDKYLLFPTSFTLVDHIAEILKQFARRDEKGFSSGCAALIGSALVKKVASYFRVYPNFRVITEVNLQKFDRSLPDIDVLSLSYEPTFGFQVFVCEVKNNLPATWAKEHLKQSDKKGALIKAFKQIERLKQFLNSEKGARLLYSIVKQAFSDLDIKALLPTGFMAAINFMIVTPQNIGVLMPTGDTVILNEDFLRHLIQKSDGDSIYLKYHFDRINTLLDDSYDVVSDSFIINGIEVKYDRPSLKHVIGFSENQYLSTGMLKAIEREGFETGYTYINTLNIDARSDDEPEL